MAKRLSEQFDPDKPIEEMSLKEKKMFIEFFDKECGDIGWLQLNTLKYKKIKKQLKRK